MSDSDPGSLEVLNFDPNQSGPLKRLLKINELIAYYGIFVEHLQILPIFTIFTIQAVKPPLAAILTPGAP